ncbi:hypothetical protein M9Y10_024602 [Tritrichomonas musculus]|uniref:Ankyrin repeat protein n=1 Tax=Tritrichomonas musculus TaxID=1915356 RepID=A0ABR2HAR6_9EUKA
MIDESLFYDVCQFDYYIIASDLLNNKNIDINQEYNRYEYSKIRIWYSICSNPKPEKIRCSKTALFRAVQKENIEIVKLLLSFDKINVNTICSYEYHDLEEWWVERTSLFLAIENNNIEIIKLLLSIEDINVNIINTDDYCDGGGCEYYYKYTALYESVEQENIEIIKLLLSNKNINVNAPSRKFVDFEGGGEPGEGKWDRSALFRAIDKENIEIVNLLLENEGIDIDAISCKLDKDGNSFFWRKNAFYRAVEKGNIEIINALLKYDFDINFINFDSGRLDEDHQKKR